uniref:lysozyme n=1 Tax=Fundulus heteroclitus TaxID=8078 RepID=A0A3Q2PKA9_FUNHE
LFIPLKTSNNVFSVKELLSDDVSAAIKCAKRVVLDPQGIAAWVGWQVHCKNQDVSKYVAGCGLD